MGIGKIDILKYIQDLKIENQNDNKIREFLSSLIYKTISGKFKRRRSEYGAFDADGRDYIFIVTRYTSNDDIREKLIFEDDKGFTYLLLWNETYHIS
jgi:hypothetical protein